MNRKICHIFTFYVSNPSSLHFFSSFLLFILTCGRAKKKSQFLKVLRAKKKQKKGCYLIKEAAINLSGSSAAPLHIWLLNSGHSLPLLLARPGWDLWFFLLVSHTVWVRFLLSTLSRWYWLAWWWGEEAGPQVCPWSALLLQLRCETAADLEATRTAARRLPEGSWNCSCPPGSFSGGGFDLILCLIYQFEIQPQYV